MNLLSRNENSRNLLSASMPVQVTKEKLESSSKLQTILKQRKRIVVYRRHYVSQTGGAHYTYYVEHAAAYALGLIKTRAIMMDSPKLVEIDNASFERLRADESIEIEYRELTNTKSSLKVYVDGSSYCIDMSAAYALGYIDDETFHNTQDKVYYIDKSKIDELSSQYKIEYYAYGLISNADKKTINR